MFILSAAWEVVRFGGRLSPLHMLKVQPLLFDTSTPLSRDFVLKVVLFRGVHAIAAPIQDTQHRGGSGDKV